MPDAVVLVRSETMRSSGRAGLTGASSCAAGEGAAGLTASAGFRFDIGASNSKAAAGQPLEFVLLEQADDAIFPVIAGITDDVTGAQARDRLGQDRGPGMRDVLDRDRLQDRKLGAQFGDRVVVAARHRVRRRAGGGELGEDLRQRHQA